METSDKFLVFVCPSAAKAADKKLSFRIASKLTSLGHAEMGQLQDLTEQHNTAPQLQKRMIFINDCRSGCVRVLTHGFDTSEFIYLDISPYIGATEFNIEHYISSEVIPKVIEKWYL
jgi:uncharacterized metal-binding protein